MEIYTNKYDILADLNTYGEAKGYWCDRLIEIQFEETTQEAWMYIYNEGDTDEIMFSNQFELLDCLEMMEEGE